MDETTIEEKYRRILKILGVRNQIIVAQAERIHQLEERLTEALNPLTMAQNYPAGRCGIGETIEREYSRVD